MNKEQQIIDWFDKILLFSNKNIIDSIFDCAKKYYYQPVKSYKLLLRTIDFLIKNPYKIDISIYGEISILFGACEYIISDYFGLNINFVLKQLRDTLVKKNRDYGNSFDRSIKKFGWIYLAIELDKKKNRLHSLLKSKEKPNYESIEDTLLDIAGYCVLSLIYIDNNKE